MHVGEQPILRDYPLLVRVHARRQRFNRQRGGVTTKGSRGGPLPKPAAQPPAAKPADGPPPKEVDVPAKGKPGKRRAKNAANGD